MKLTPQDILKPGAILVTEKIDFNDPEFKRFAAITRRNQKAMMRNKNRPFKNYVITI